MERVAQAIQRLVEMGLGIDPLEMIVQIVATVVLIVVVKFMFWNKVTAFIEGRQEIMDKALTDATAKNEEAEALRADAEKAYEQIKDEARSILEEAKTQSEDTKRKILQDAKDEAANIKKSAQRDLAQEIEVARSKMRDEIVSVAVKLSEKVIAKELDEATYYALVDAAVESVEKR